MGGTIVSFELARQELALALNKGVVYGSQSGARKTWPLIHAEAIRDLLLRANDNNNGLVPDPRGLRLRHVRILGRLDLDHVHSSVPLGLTECDLHDGLTAVHANLPLLTLDQLRIVRYSVDEAVIHLEESQLGGLSLTGSILINGRGPALDIDRIKLDSSLHLGEGFIAIGHGDQGAVRMLGARIAGQLKLQGAMLSNDDGPALSADRLTVESSASFQKLDAYGDGATAAVRLLGATIKGQLNLGGAKLVNRRGPALLADGLTVISDAYFDEEFSATGSGEMGAIHLVGANLHGQLSMRSANLKNRTGPALRAEGLTVVSDAYFDKKFSATGSGELGVVRLSKASIGGHLSLCDEAVTNISPFREPTSYITDEKTVDSLVTNKTANYHIIPGKRARSSSSSCSRALTMVLEGATIDSSLKLSDAALICDASTGCWDIDSLTYKNLKIESESWLKFLRNRTYKYSKQPYQQYASIARAQGDEELTQKILIAQQDDLLFHNKSVFESQDKIELLTSRQQFGLRLLRTTVGYGYKTERALMWLTLIVILAVGTAFIFGSDAWAVRPIIWTSGALQQPIENATSGVSGPCLKADLVLLGADIVPLIPLAPNLGERCAATNTTAGIAFVGIYIVLKLMAWALVTLFVAGYTNIVRKPGP